MGKYQSVLLIDDNEIDNFINQKILKISSFAESIVSIHSGLSALEYLQSIVAEPNLIPDIIFLDINMPYMNGFEFLEELMKLDDAIINKIKVYMLTSSIDVKDFDKAMKYPLIQKFLIKPLSNTTLNEL